MQSLLRFASILFLIGCVTLARAEAAPAPLARGINIHLAMNWAAIDARTQRYSFPPFEGAAYRLDADEIAALRQAGFDFVRLTIDPGPFLQYTGRERDALDVILLDRVHRILSGGMTVIVDFHPNRQDKAYLPEKFTGSPGDPIVAAHAAVLTRTAKLLGTLDNDRVLLELLNEPDTSGPLAARRWQETLTTYYAAARRGSASLTLVLSGGRGGSADGLTEIDPAPFDDRVVFTFHVYTPLPFTLQGTPGDKTVDLTEVPFPLGASLSAKTQDAIRARIAATETDPQRQAARYATSVNYVAWIVSRGPASTDPARNFADVQAWARRYRIPAQRILLGEFGATRNVGPFRGAPEGDRARWFREVRQLADQHGFPWAYWVYRGVTGMMLVRTLESRQFDPATIDALGLAATDGPERK